MSEWDDLAKEYGGDKLINAGAPDTSDTAAGWDALRREFGGGDVQLAGGVTVERPLPDWKDYFFNPDYKPQASEDMMMYLSGKRYEPTQPKAGFDEYPSINNLGRSAGEIAHGLMALEGLGQRRVTEAMPAFHPAGKMKPWPYSLPDFEVPAFNVEGGKPLWREGDAKFIQDNWTNLLPLTYYSEKYLRPAARQDWHSLWRNISHDPMGTALDLVSGPVHGTLRTAGKAAAAVAGATGRAVEPAVRGSKIIQGAGRGLAAVATALGAAKAGAIKSIPALYARMYVGEALKALPPREAQFLERATRRLDAAMAKIDPADRPYLNAAMERTDPAFEHLLKKPEIAAYVRLHEKIANINWQMVRKMPGVRGEDFLAARFGPEIQARALRGELKLPQRANGSTIDPLTMTAADLYDPEMRRFIKGFARDVYKQEGMAGFQGRYVPLVYSRQVEQYHKQRSDVGWLTAAQAEPIKSAQKHREKASIKTITLGQWAVMGQRDLGHARNPAEALSYKLGITAAYAHVHDWLERTDTFIDSLPKAQREAVSREIASRFGPLLRDVGIDATIYAKYQKRVSEAVASNADLDRWTRLMEEGLRGTQKHESLTTALYHSVATAQRICAVVADPLLYPFVVAQDWANYFFHNVRGPQSMMNAIIAAKLVHNQNVLRRLPQQVLERRMTYVPPTNPLIRRLAESWPGKVRREWMDKLYDQMNAVRAAQACLLFIEEYERLPKAAQRFVLEALKRQQPLGEKAKSLLLAKYKEVHAVQQAIQGQAKMTGLRKSGLEWQRFSRDVDRHVNWVFGRYDQQYRGVQRALHGTFIWWSMIKQMLTLSAVIAMDNPLKLAVARYAGARAWEMQKEEGKRQQLPQWAIDAGAWKLDRKAPNGDMLVQMPAGLTLWTDAFKLPALAGLMTNPEDPMAGAIDFQTNMIPSGVSLFLAGQKSPFQGFLTALTQGKYEGRPLRNPYIYRYGGSQGTPFDVMMMARENIEGKGVDVRQSKYIRTMPYPDLLNQVLLTGAYSFSNKLTTTAKKAQGQWQGFRPSDITVPGVPGMEYPKTSVEIDRWGHVRRAELASPLVVYPTTLLPGGARYAPAQLRNKSEGEIRYEQMMAQDPKVIMRQKSSQAQLRPRVQALRYLWEKHPELFPKVTRQATGKPSR